MNINKRTFLISIAVIAILPLIFGDNPYIMHILTLALIWSVVASAWDLIVGYAYAFSFGQMAIFAVGGYTSSMMALYWDVSPFLSIAAGAGSATLIGLAIGLPCLRLRGMYVAVVTLALHLVLPTLLREGRIFGTGGSRGLGGIPPLEILGQPLGMFGWYYVSLGIFCALLFLIYKIINSSIGLAFVSLRDAHAAASSLGVNEYRYKLMVFGISAFITGLMGGFYSHYIGIISPAILGTDIFLMVITMMLFGGLGRFPGAVIGAFTITVANELLRPAGSFRLLILGAIIVVTLIYMPRGLIGLLESLGNWMNRVKSQRLGMRHKETI